MIEIGTIHILISTLDTFFEYRPSLMYMYICGKIFLSDKIFNQKKKQFYNFTKIRFKIFDVPSLFIIIIFLIHYKLFFLCKICLCFINIKIISKQL